jgi:hypothetical protein
MAVGTYNMLRAVESLDVNVRYHNHVSVDMRCMAA